MIHFPIPLEKKVLKSIHGGAAPKRPPWASRERTGAVWLKRVISSAWPWGRGELSKEGFGVIVEVAESWFSDLSCPYRTVVGRLGDEILLFKGRMERVEFPQVGLGMCLCLGSRWWCLVMGEGSPSITVCSTGKETLVETTQDHASLPCVVNQREAKRCVGVIAYLVMGQLWFLPYS